MKNKTLIVSSLLVAAILSLLWQRYFDAEALKLSISTDKTEYNSGSALKVTIQNNSKKDVCFSSCYPYYLERKNSNFESYSYSVCQLPDSNQVCVEPRHSKFFETTLPPLETGIHRMAIPACVGCKIQESFKEDKKFYSNEFMISQ